MKKLYVFLGSALGLLLIYLLLVYLNIFGKHRGPGIIAGKGLKKEDYAKRASLQRSALKKFENKKKKAILFGDLHVHTTYSADAFLMSLPFLRGVGSHPIGDACDFARYCSQVDFWSISDHAESSTPLKWKETIKAIRQCDSLATDKNNPDLVSFLGFEWSQVGGYPKDHYGHKNVIFKGIGDEDISLRPIGAAGLASAALRQNASPLPVGTPLLDPKNRQVYYDFRYFQKEITETPECDRSLPSSKLPRNCYESAWTPKDLVERLEDQKLDYLLIPHGTTWGLYSPPTASLDKQLKPEMRPEKQEIFEIFSGHGNSEEYRSWKEAYWKDGKPQCQRPYPNYMPSCWRAGIIIKERCLKEGHDKKECLRREIEARENYISIGTAGHITVKGESAEDWLNAGQCQDCFLPAFNYRPRSSAQYGLAISNFEKKEPTRFKWGFIGSSDNHRARPGTGFKEHNRYLNAEVFGAVSKEWRKALRGSEKKINHSVKYTVKEVLADPRYQVLLDWDKQASFWMTGGLAAVHAESRTRDGIWKAFKKREVYGTSGPRILLWFDLIHNKRISMGGEIGLSENPKFKVTAIGAFKQRPGCPEMTVNGLSPERLKNLCLNECYNPSDERLLINRIEVIRIRPQIVKGESVDKLIEDPWKKFNCAKKEEGCVFEFEDPDYVKDGRDSIYYVRAIQEPTLTINGGNLRCEKDSLGKCISTKPCHGTFLSEKSDDCLTSVEHRAWSSPIYVNFKKGQ
ncbi:DUF3604 domain-containing protein [Bacteriovoracales bacterium]|nr:DUF3604 domain-containing protein [Bacteriovoracales bacterium]